MLSRLYKSQQTWLTILHFYITIISPFPNLFITSQIHDESTPWSFSPACPRGDVDAFREVSWCRQRIKPSWTWSGSFYHHQVGRWWRWFGPHVPANTKVGILLMFTFPPFLQAEQFSIVNCHASLVWFLVYVICLLLAGMSFRRRDHVSCPLPNGRLLVVYVAIR